MVSHAQRSSKHLETTPLLGAKGALNAASAWADGAVQVRGAVSRRESVAREGRCVGRVGEAPRRGVVDPVPKRELQQIHICRVGSE